MPVSEYPLQINKTRLSNGDHGRVELLVSGFWGSVCEDSVGTQEANVLCRMAGYSYVNLRY